MTKGLRWDWYLIEVWGGMMDTARCEIVAAALPFEHPQTWRREQLKNGHRVAVPYPRLPGNYAFVQLAREPDDNGNKILKEQVSALLRLRGVKQVFRSPGAVERFATVPKHEIQDLKDADARERKEASSARWQPRAVRFKAEMPVRIVRHATAEGHIGIFAYSVKGMATITMDNGVKISLPECDLGEVDGRQSRVA